MIWSLIDAAGGIDVRNKTESMCQTFYMCMNAADLGNIQIYRTEIYIL